uniref:2'-5' oligoadenylate synthase n=1 Tax=Gopherus evgoodei TaxID=1825980 RepID=A0A8C4Y8D6_9SAUR
MALDLYQMPARKLDKFIFDALQPDSTFLRQAGQAIDTICEFLKKNCFADCPPPRIKVLKVVKGGSLGKGTSLKDSSDADLVVFLSCFKGYGDQETNRAGIIKEIERMLEKCQQEKHFEVFIEQSRWPNPRVLSFKMSSETLDESIEFDVLPAYNALSSGAKPMSQVYEELIQSCSRGGEFSTCFTELQRDFVVDRRTKVKSLIRLVKYWYKQGESLPPQYALELLSVYAWEQGSRDRAFNMAEGFRTVLELIQQYKHLCVYWTINYNFADEVLAGFLHHQLQKARPIILDPADPTGIVGEGSRWDLLAQEAECCCRQQCCMDLYGVPVQPWDVPELALHPLDGNTGASLSHSVLAPTCYPAPMSITSSSRPLQGQVSCAAPFPCVSAFTLMLPVSLVRLPLLSPPACQALPTTTGWHILPLQWTTARPLSGSEVN